MWLIKAVEEDGQIKYQVGHLKRVNSYPSMAAVDIFVCPINVLAKFVDHVDALAWCSFLNGGMHPTMLTQLRTQVEKLVKALGDIEGTIRDKVRPQ